MSFRLSELLSVCVHSKCSVLPKWQTKNRFFSQFALTESEQNVCLIRPSSVNTELIEFAQSEITLYKVSAHQIRGLTGLSPKSN